jgi:hypothetical protein
MTDHPFILAWASHDAPLEVQLQLSGVNFNHMIVASRVLGLEGDSTYRLNVSVYAQGGGMTVDRRAFPGTFTLALVTLPDGGGASLDASAGTPPSADFLWIASVLLDVRARSMLGRQFAEQDARTSGLVVGRGGQIRS